ncbi:hypothetical protein REH81_32220, partial [Vibrio rotiferianus]
MIDRLKIWMSSKSLFWKLRVWMGNLSFIFERNAYHVSASVSKSKASIRILGSFAWIGTKSLLGVLLCLATLIFVEGY